MLEPPMLSMRKFIIEHISLTSFCACVCMCICVCVCSSFLIYSHRLQSYQLRFTTILNCHICPENNRNIYICPRFRETHQSPSLPSLTLNLVRRKIYCDCQYLPPSLPFLSQFFSFSISFFLECFLFFMKSIGG